MRWVATVALCCVACGRRGFEPAVDASPGNGSGVADAGSGGPPEGDGATSDATDAMMPAIACADRNLGSALGPNVASGSTAGEGNQYSACSGDGNDITFGWFAPATAMYRIDLCASAPMFDTVLYVRNGSCTGAQLACNDDACGGLGGLASRVTVSLTAGQGVVIIVDELFPTGGGNYQLAITQL